MARIGLIAGEGKLPLIFLRAAKEKGDTVIAFALKGVTDPELERHADKIHWIEWGKWQKGLLLLAMERIKKIVMLGKLKKESFFKDDRELDPEAKSLMEKLGDKKDYAILNEVTKAFGKLGMEVIDSTTYMKDLIPSVGILTKTKPTPYQEEDINFAVRVAKELSRFDIGQTVAVKDKTVIAVEAMEGTDATIIRAGTLTRGGFIVVKMARPDQDMRFDVPLVGLSTLEAMIRSGGEILALESGKTLLMDKKEVISLADEKGIVITVV